MELTGREGRDEGERGEQRTAADDKGTHSDHGVQGSAALNFHG